VRGVGIKMPGRALNRFCYGAITLAKTNPPVHTITQILKTNEVFSVLSICGQRFLGTNFAS
jgi:hypothetical protein